MLKNEKLEMRNWKSIDFFCLLLPLHFVFLTFYYCKWIIPTIPVLHTVHHSLGYITYINLEQYWIKIHPKGKTHIKVKDKLQLDNVHKSIICSKLYTLSFLMPTLNYVCLSHAFSDLLSRITN